MLYTEQTQKRSSPISGSDLPMTPHHILQLAFENVAGHISNLDDVQTLVREMLEENITTEMCISLLESKMADSEVTLVTDIRILLNEIHHILREKSP